MKLVRAAKTDKYECILMFACYEVDRKRNVRYIGTLLQLIYSPRASISYKVYLQIVTTCPANVETYSSACAPRQRSPGEVVMVLVRLDRRENTREDERMPLLAQVQAAQNPANFC